MGEPTLKLTGALSILALIAAAAAASGKPLKR
jgi:hypothetical protein